MGICTNWFKDLVVKCDICCGKGIIPDGLSDKEFVDCVVCEGKGFIEKVRSVITEEEILCTNPLCNKGKINKKVIVNKQAIDEELDCPICQGLGRLIIEKNENYTGHMSCKVCQGTGVLSGLEVKKKKLEYFCKKCKGLGYCFNKKKVIMLLPFILIIFFNPLISFVFLMFVTILFSLNMLKSKNK